MALQQVTSQPFTLEMNVDGKFKKISSVKIASNCMYHARVMVGWHRWKGSKEYCMNNWMQGAFRKIRAKSPRKFHENDESVWYFHLQILPKQKVKIH